MELWAALPPILVGRVVRGVGGSCNRDKSTLYSKKLGGAGAGGGVTASEYSMCEV